MRRGASAPRLVAWTGRYSAAVDRPGRFEDFRYLGDKRNQRVYDVDAAGPDLEPAINELCTSEQFVCFGPDTLAEARNRGYHLHPPAGPAADDE